MKTRTLAPGLDVGPIGYGAMVLVHGMYGANEDDRSVAALRHAADAGATLIDTADAYGTDHHNERLVGRAFAGRRGDVALATKWGIAASPDGARRVTASYANEIWVDGRPERARPALEASLAALGTDQVDLWYLHFPDPGVPVEESVGAMAELVAEGKARHLGLSNVTAEQVRAAHAVHPIAAVQLEWSLWTRTAEAELLPALRELGIGRVAWGPLGNGFLAGDVDAVAVDDFRRNAPRFAPDNLARNRDRFAPLRALAQERGITPAQLALAWLLRQDEDVVPIPGSRTPAHIDENLAAAEVALDDDELARIDGIAPVGAAVGAALLCVSAPRPAPARRTP
jgi:aryl-alcohol dehydrogenase-like predicted oxidoreductase